MTTQYFPNALRDPELVNHRGKVIALAYSNDDDSRDIYYRVLDLKVTSRADESDWTEFRKLMLPETLQRALSESVDKAYWSDRLEAPQLRVAGMDLLTLPSSLTRAQAAKWTFRVLSDGEYIYLFRPSDAGTVYVNRFILIESKEQRSAERAQSADYDLQPAWEVRFQRSENKCLPQSEQDVPAYADAENRAFLEPTIELSMVRHTGGCFEVLQIPAKPPHAARWQFFTLNGDDIQSYSIAKDGSGLFDFSQSWQIRNISASTGKLLGFYLTLPPVPSVSGTIAAQTATVLGGKYQVVDSNNNKLEFVPTADLPSGSSFTIAVSGTFLALKLVNATKTLWELKGVAADSISFVKDLQRKATPASLLPVRGLGAVLYGQQEDFKRPEAHADAGEEKMQLKRAARVMLAVPVTWAIWQAELATVSRTAVVTTPAASGPVDVDISLVDLEILSDVSNPKKCHFALTFESQWKKTNSTDVRARHEQRKTFGPYERGRGDFTQLLSSSLTVELGSGVSLPGTTITISDFLKNAVAPASYDGVFVANQELAIRTTASGGRTCRLVLVPDNRRPSQTINFKIKQGKSLQKIEVTSNAADPAKRDVKLTVDNSNWFFAFGLSADGDVFAGELLKGFQGSYKVADYLEFNPPIQVDGTVASQQSIDLSVTATGSFATDLDLRRGPGTATAVFDFAVTADGLLHFPNGAGTDAVSFDQLTYIDGSLDATSGVFTPDTFSPSYMASYKQDEGLASYAYLLGQVQVGLQHVDNRPFLEEGAEGVVRLYYPEQEDYPISTVAGPRNGTLMAAHHECKTARSKLELPLKDSKGKLTLQARSAGTASDASRISVKDDVSDKDRLCNLAVVYSKRSGFHQTAVSDDEAWSGLPRNAALAASILNGSGSDDILDGLVRRGEAAFYDYTGHYTMAWLSAEQGGLWMVGRRSDLMFQNIKVDAVDKRDDKRKLTLTFKGGGHAYTQVWNTVPADIDNAFLRLDGQGEDGEYQPDSGSGRLYNLDTEQGPILLLSREKDTLADGAVLEVADTRNRSDQCRLLLRNASGGLIWMADGLARKMETHLLGYYLQLGAVNFVEEIIPQSRTFTAAECWLGVKGQDRAIQLTANSTLPSTTKIVIKGAGDALDVELQEANGNVFWSIQGVPKGVVAFLAHTLRDHPGRTFPALAVVGEKYLQVSAPRLDERGGCIKSLLFKYLHFDASQTVSGSLSPQTVGDDGHGVYTLIDSSSPTTEVLKLYATDAMPAGATIDMVSDAAGLDMQLSVDGQLFWALKGTPPDVILSDYLTVGSVVGADGEINVQIQTITAGSCSLSGTTGASVPLAPTSDLPAGTRMVINADGAKLDVELQDKDAKTFWVLKGAPKKAGDFAEHIRTSPGSTCYDVSLSKYMTAGIVSGAEGEINVQIQSSTAGSFSLSGTDGASIPLTTTSELPADTQMVIKADGVKLAIELQNKDAKTFWTLKGAPKKAGEFAEYIRTSYGSACHDVMLSKYLSIGIVAGPEGEINVQTHDNTAESFSLSGTAGASMSLTPILALPANTKVVIKADGAKLDIELQDNNAKTFWILKGAPKKAGEFAEYIRTSSGRTFSIAPAARVLGHLASTPGTEYSTVDVPEAKAPLSDYFVHVSWPDACVGPAAAATAPPPSLMLGNQSGGALDLRQTRGLFAVVRQGARGSFAKTAAAVAAKAECQKHTYHGLVAKENHFLGFSAATLLDAKNQTPEDSVFLLNVVDVSASGGKDGGWMRAPANDCLRDLKGSQYAGPDTKLPSADLLRPGRALTLETWLKPDSAKFSQVITANFGDARNIGEVTPRYMLGLRGQIVAQMSSYEYVTANVARYHGAAWLAGSHPAFHLGYEPGAASGNVAPFTIEAWISLSAWRQLNDITQYCIVQAISPVQPNMPAYQLALNNDGYLVFSCMESQSSPSSAPKIRHIKSTKKLGDVIDDLGDNWYHVAVTYSGGKKGTLTFYIEGEYASSEPNVNFFNGYGSPILYLGAGCNTAFKQDYQRCASLFGQIAEVRLWSDNKSEGELRVNRYRVLSTEENLVGCWRLGMFAAADGKPIVYDSANPKLAAGTTAPNSAEATMGHGGAMLLLRSVPPDLTNINQAQTVELQKDAPLLEAFAAVGQADGLTVMPVLASAFVRPHRWSHLALRFAAPGAVILNELPSENRPSENKHRRFDFLNSAYAEDFNIGRAFTLEARVKATDLATGQCAILSRWQEDGAQTSYELGMEDSCFYLSVRLESSGDGETITVKSKLNPDKDVHYHVVGTGEIITEWDSKLKEDVDKLQICLYVDGSLSGAYEPGDTWHRADSKRKFKHTTADLLIGARAVRGLMPVKGGVETALNFHGLIAAPRLWSRALTAEEIKTAYQERRLPANTNGLIANWLFHEGFGRVAEDADGKHTARLSSGVSWGSCEAAGHLELYCDGSRLQTRTVNAVDAISDPTSAAAGKASFGIVKPDATPPDNKLPFVRFGGGRGDDAIFTNGFDGQIDEVRIWNVARTEEQLRDDLYRPLLGHEPGLVGYWNFNGDPDNGISDAVRLSDKAGHGNDLKLHWVGTNPLPTLGASTSPLAAREGPRVRMTYGGPRTGYQSTACGRACVAEYADVQLDAYGNLFSVMKRAYAYPHDSEGASDVDFVTGYKIGDLGLTYVGQIQTEPKVVGYIEGAPPIPGENCTRPYWTYLPYLMAVTDGNTVTLTQSKTLSWSYGFADERAWTFAAEAQATFSFGGTTTLAPEFHPDDPFKMIKMTQDTDFGVSVAPKFGLGLEWNNDAGGESSTAWTFNTSDQMSTSCCGNWEPYLSDRTQYWYPEIGRRFLFDNMGYASVESTTADLYVQRLLDTGAMVGMTILPNKDIPPDSNIILFPINSRYQKQGSLDGKVGLKNDPDYPNGDRVRGSYFKPLEAYRLKNQVLYQAVEEERKWLSESIKLEGFTGPSQDRMKNIEGKAGADVGFQLEREAPKLEDAAKSLLGEAEDHLGKATIGEQAKELTGSKAPSKNMFVQTVWTAAGGMHQEGCKFATHREIHYGSAFSFTGSIGLSVGFTDINPAPKSMSVFVPSIDISLDFMATHNVKKTLTKARSQDQDFGLNVAISVDGFLKSWIQDPVEPTAGVYSVLDCPGKVNGYRFYSFYLQPDKQHGEALFRDIIDPYWLNTSAEPNAVALRAVRNADPECWRVLHRVTYVSRVPPKFNAQSNELLPPPDRIPACLEGNALLLNLICHNIAGDSPSVAEIGSKVGDYLDSGSGKDKLKDQVSWWPVVSKLAAVTDDSIDATAEVDGLLDVLTPEELAIVKRDYQAVALQLTAAKKIAKRKRDQARLLKQQVVSYLAQGYAAGALTKSGIK